MNHGATKDAAAPAADPSAREVSEDSETDIPATRDGRLAVLITTAICALIGGAGHVTLLVGWEMRGDSASNALAWQPVVGASLSVVAIVAFGGFYYASLRARVAIMSAFVLTFLLLLTYVLTIREISDAASQALATALVDDFRAVLQTIIAFYFGTETLISITKLIKSPPGAASRRADRDLPAG
jgi:hypothetical protein